MTLLEVLLVIAILGMLATVLAVVVFPQFNQARVKTTELNVQSKIPSALQKYNLDIGHFPTEEEGGLKALVTKPSFDDEALGAKWIQQLNEQDLKDAWGNDINYEVVDASAGETITDGFKVWSNGKDGQSGTDDDIRSWKEESGV